MNLDTSKPIKSVSYNGVDVPVYNAPDAPVPLWTNASPTSFFSGQTVTLGGDYDGFIIEAKYSASAANTVTHYKNIVFAGTVGGVIAASKGTSINSGTVTLRPITEVTRNSISFGDGRNEGASYAAPQLCIPTRIWGVKFTL